MEEARVVELPYPQGPITACAHIALAATCRILRNPQTSLLTPPTHYQESIFGTATRCGLLFHEISVKKRRETQSDPSTYFTAGLTVSACRADLRQSGTTPWFKDRHQSGFIALRARVSNDADPSGEQGCMPRLVDELDAVYRRMRTSGIDQGIVLTAYAYTRCIVMRLDEGLFMYDSHGQEHSKLFIYGHNLPALATHLLQTLGVTDPRELQENLRQMADPLLRTVDCEFDATQSANWGEFEMVVLECVQPPNAPITQ